MNSDSSKTKTACFFDSGIGGLPLMYKCYELRSDFDFAYFADNYNVPYGNKTHKEISDRVSLIFEKMALLEPTVAVVACNTVTAECIEDLRRKYSFPIIGIQPAVKPAAERSAKCVVLATQATADSYSLQKLIGGYGGGHTEAVACKNLAEYIESNIFNLNKEEIFGLLPKISCDGIVLGCTHYSYIADIVADFYGCPVYDGTDGTADRFCKILGKPDHQRKQGTEVAFYGGNCLKNSKIFEYLKENQRK